MPNRITASIPAAWSSDASATSSPIEKRSIPGIEVDRLAHTLAGDDEEGLDEVPRRELRLAHEVAEGLRPPQAPHARSGEAHHAHSR